MRRPPGEPESSSAGKRSFRRACYSLASLLMSRYYFGEDIIRVLPSTHGAL